jgi:hypothetical protein
MGMDAGVRCLRAADGRARAQFATGGVGPYRNNIVWIAWGNNGDRVSGTLTRTNVTPVAGQFLRTICTASALNGGMTRTHPQRAGVSPRCTTTPAWGRPARCRSRCTATTRPPRTFNLSCSATFGPTGTASDPPFAMVAWSWRTRNRTANTGEWEQGQPAGRQPHGGVIDRYRPSTCAVQRCGGRGVRQPACACKAQNATSSVCNATVPEKGRDPWRWSSSKAPRPAGFALRGGRCLRHGARRVRERRRSWRRTVQLWGRPAFAAVQLVGGHRHGHPTGQRSRIRACDPEHRRRPIQFGARADTEIIDQSSANANGDDAAGIDDEDALPAGPNRPAFVRCLHACPTCLASVPAPPCAATSTGIAMATSPMQVKPRHPPTCSGGQTNIAWGAAPRRLARSEFPAPAHCGQRGGSGEPDRRGRRRAKWRTTPSPWSRRASRW